MEYYAAVPRKESWRVHAEGGVAIPNGIIVCILGGWGFLAILQIAYLRLHHRMVFVHY